MDEPTKISAFQKMDYEEKAQVLAGILVDMRKRANGGADFDLTPTTTKIPTVWIWRIANTALIVIFGLAMTVVALRYPTKEEIAKEYVTKESLSVIADSLKAIQSVETTLAGDVHLLQINLAGVQANSLRIDGLDTRLRAMEVHYREQ